MASGGMDGLFKIFDMKTCMKQVGLVRTPETRQNGRCTRMAYARTRTNMHGLYGNRARPRSSSSRSKYMLSWSCDRRLGETKRLNFLVVHRHVAIQHHAKWLCNGVPAGLPEKLCLVCFCHCRLMEPEDA